MPKFAIVMARRLHCGLLKPGDQIEDAEYDCVAHVEADDLEDAYDLTQNGNHRFWDPEQSPQEQANYTLTWTRDHRVTLTDVGHRLKHPKMNDSLRSVSVGDIIYDVNVSGRHIVASMGFLKLEDHGSYATVVVQPVESPNPLVPQ